MGIQGGSTHWISFDRAGVPAVPEPPLSSEESDEERVGPDDGLPDRPLIEAPGGRPHPDVPDQFDSPPCLTGEALQCPDEVDVLPNPRRLIVSADSLEGVSGTELGSPCTMPSERLRSLQARR